MASVASSSHRSRARPSAAASSSSRENNNNRPPTPEYEPLQKPLNAQAQQSLAALLAAPHFRLVKDHIHKAGGILTETASEANERASDARYRFVSNSEKRKRAATAKRRKKTKTEKQDGDNEIEDEDKDNEDEDEDEEEEEEEEEEEDEEEQQKRQEELRKLESLEERVKTATVQLEERMRGVVDAEYKFSRLRTAIQQMARDAEAEGTKLNEARRRANLRDKGAVDADGDEDMDDADADEDPAPTVVPSQVLTEKLADDESQWENQSLTQRYTSNNAYVGFYSAVHEAKHFSDEKPPVPHASTWFKHLEQRQGSGGRRRPTSSSNTPNRANQHDDDDDEEIEIARERISLKCPITLLTFEDPVKSNKCPHSFERQAIEDMIRASSNMVPAGPNDMQGGADGVGRNARARRVRAVACPVCPAMLTLNDLEPDLVTLRRVRRAHAAELREQEEVELGGRRRRGLHRESSGVVIDSGDDDSDAGEVDEEEREREIQERIRIKKERSSRAPTTAEDGMEEDEEDDDDDEEEDED